MVFRENNKDAPSAQKNSLNVLYFLQYVVRNCQDLTAFMITVLIFLHKFDLNRVDFLGYC